MPIYEYECQECQAITDDARLVDRRDEPGICPRCQGATHRVWVTPPSVQAFEGSDRKRSRDDNWLNLVREAQSEGIRSPTEVEEGTAQAHDRAKKMGVGVDKILGPKGRPEPWKHKDRAKREAVEQHRTVTKVL